MRTTIADAAPLDHRPFVVTSDEGAGTIIVEAGGLAVRVRPDEAKQLAWALVQAVGLVERSIRRPDGEGASAELVADFC